MKLLETESYISLEQVSCPNCSSNESTIEAIGPDYDCHCCGDQEFTLVACKHCGVYYINPRPRIEELPKIYPPSSYYSYDFTKKTNKITLRARLARDLQKVRAISRILCRPPQELKILDIGAGDGALLDAFHADGYLQKNLYGIELDKYAANIITDKGYNAIVSRIEDLSNLEMELDAVTLIQLIEHISDPKAVLLKVYKFLKNGGLIVIETPNMGSWDRPLFRQKTWGGYHFPRHWTLWDTITIQKTLLECGFETVEVKTLPAAVLWIWTLNHIAQQKLTGKFSKIFTMNNPILLGLLWLIELTPSILGKSANMRIIARKK